MKALLLAAGAGSRLQPLTNFIPKCLVPVGGVPLLEIWLELLTSTGIDRILINTCYMADKVEKYIASSKYANRILVMRENELLGTAGSVRAYREWIGDQDVLIAHADNLSLCDYRDFISAHANRPQGSICTMMTFLTDKPESCGIVTVNKDGGITNYQEKSPAACGNLANAAVYMASPEFCDIVAQLNVEDIGKDVIPTVYERMSTFHNRVYHRDIGTLESFALAQIEWPLAQIEWQLLREKWN